MEWGIFTDLDGTLLDRSYSWTGAEAALHRLVEQEIPLVLVTTKTESEVLYYIRLYREEFGGGWITAIFDNGGGILWRPLHANTGRLGNADPELRSLALGLPIPQLREGLKQLESQIGFRAVSILDMSQIRFLEYTGLKQEMAEAALQRQFDLPFIIESEPPDWKDLTQSAQCLGLQVTRGGLFYHLHGADKKKAAAWIIQEVRAEIPLFRWVGLGDSQVDIGFLQLVDRPVLIPKAVGQPDPAVLEALPNIRVAPAPAPEGWAAAVIHWLEEVQPQGVAASTSQPRTNPSS